MLSNLRGAGESVIYGRGTPFLLHEYGLPLLPAARWLGHVSLRRLVSGHRFGQLPLLPVVVGCRDHNACSRWRSSVLRRDRQNKASDSLYLVLV